MKEVLTINDVFGGSDCQTRYNDLAKFKDKEPLTGRQKRTERRKLKRKFSK